VSVNFGLTVEDYARHRAGFPDSLYERLTKFGIGTPGQRIVDLGTGTGTLARGFASRGCRVTGIDPSPEMLAGATRMAESEGLAIDFSQGTAESTGLLSACADVVTAGQCWHWFEPHPAAAEVARLLQPGGRLMIAHFDWIPLRGNVVEATERLILAHNPAWPMAGGAGLYPEWLRQLGEAGFQGLESFSYDENVPYTPAGWRGRIRASAGVGASLSPSEVAVFDKELEGILTTWYSAESLAVPHRIFVVIAWPPSLTR
jgi:SAM-dependent methyltransferase